VRQDYEERLAALLEQLRHHADAVASRLQADQEEHDLLRDNARAVREALAEAELRHAVGEYDAARFEAERTRHVSDLESYELALDAVAERIAGLEDVHLAVIRPSVAASDETEPPTVPEPEIESEVEAADLVADEAVFEEVTIEELAPAPDSERDSDDLLSIFDQADPGEVSSHPGRDDGNIEFVEPPSAAPTPGFGPLSFTPTGAPELGGPARPVVPSLTPPLGMPGIDQSPRFVRPAPERGSELVELPADRGERFRVIPDPDPVLPEAAAAEGPEVNARTLRCAECGAMNRPLEWYCEKCGAELTAV
jgi:hypothetical protein